MPAAPCLLTRHLRTGALNFSTPLATAAAGTSADIRALPVTQCGAGAAPDTEDDSRLTSAVTPDGFDDKCFQLQKLEQFRTQDEFMTMLSQFYSRNTDAPQSVLLIVADMRECSQARINFVRLMIEQKEAHLAGHQRSTGGSTSGTSAPRWAQRSQRYPTGHRAEPVPNGAAGRAARGAMRPAGGCANNFIW